LCQIVAGAYPSPAVCDGKQKFVIDVVVVAGAYPSPAIYVTFMFVVAGAYPSPAIYVTALSCLLFLLGFIPHQLAGAYPSPAVCDGKQKIDMYVVSLHRNDRKNKNLL
jgi:hypothetical protein